MNELEKASSDLEAAIQRGNEFTAALADAKARRSMSALNAILGDKDAEKARLAAIADQAYLSALLDDLEDAKTQANARIAAAKAHAEALSRATFEERVKLRLGRVLSEHPELVGELSDREFVSQAINAYRWLSALYRQPEVDRSRYLTFWMDEFRLWARHSAASSYITTMPFLAAAYAHGDIVIENGGQSYNIFLGINLYHGRAANSVPLDGKPHAQPAHSLQESNPSKPILVELHDAGDPQHISFREEDASYVGSRG